MDIATIKKLYPRINAAEEKALAKRIRAGRRKGEQGDVFTADALQARDSLINANYGLVGKALTMYSKKRVLSDDRYDDLFQWGCRGLMRAAECFNPGFGWKFSTYAIPSILQNIKRGDRGDTVIRIPDRKWCEGDMGEHEGKILRIVSLNTSGESGRREGYDVADKCTDLDLNDVEFARSLLKRITDDKIRKIVELRFGMIGNRELMTLDQIGRRFGFSKERARQLINIGLAKIRESLQEQK